MARRAQTRRDALGGDAQIEGRHPVREALRAGRPLRRLVVSRAASGDRSVHELIAAARQRGIPVQEVEPGVLERIAQTRAPQGVVAIAAAHRTVELEEVLEAGRARSEPPFLILLDGVQDPGNLGAIVRSADAAGAHGVVIPRHRSAGLTAAAAASSAGAVEHMPVAQVANMASAVELLKREGVWVVGADPGAAEELFEAELLPPLALVLGGEGAGLSRLVRERCDRLLRIPMHGAVGSLNVSVAAGILLFEVRRQIRRTRGGPS